VPEPVPSPAGFPWLRRALIGFLATMAVLVAGAFIVPFVLPQTMTRGLAAAVIGRGLGHPVVISGATELSILPRLSVEAREISALVDEGDDTPVIFDIPYLLAEIDAVGVILSRIHILALHMESPVVRLAIDRAGRASWRDAAPAPRPDAVRPDHDWGIWRELQVDSIKITNGRLVFDDRRSGRRIVAEKVGLSSSNPVNTPDGPGLLIGGGAIINGERFAMKFETGQASKFISGDRLPVVIDVVGAPLTFRFQGGAALRQFFVSEGTADLTIRDLAHVNAWLGGLFTTPVQGAVKASARFSANGPRVNLENINIRTDAGQTKGALSMRRDSAGNRIVEAEFETNVLDLTPFIPASTGTAPPSHLAAVFDPRAAAGNVQVHWKDLRYGALRLGPGRAKVVLGSRQHYMDAAVSLESLYRGVGQARLRLGHAEGMTSLNFQMSARRVGSRAFLTDAVGATPLSGTADMSVEFLSVGATPSQIVAALRGKGTFNIRNGEILDANLAGHLGGDDAAALPFAQLVGSFAVRQGVIRGEDLLLRARRFNLVGAGSIDLAGNSLSIDLRTLDTTTVPRGGIRPFKPFRVEGQLSAFQIVAE